MSKGSIGFIGAVVLFVAIAVTWARVGGFAHAYQETDTKVWADLTPQFASTSLCQGCHPDLAKIWEAGKHSMVNCQVCHGPAQKHTQGEGKPTKDTSQALCAYCHSTVTGRPDTFPTVVVSVHAGEKLCVTCHNPHAPVGRSRGK